MSEFMKTVSNLEQNFRACHRQQAGLCRAWKAWGVSVKEGWGTQPWCLDTS